MKILLIKPDNPIKTVTPPLGLMYISSCVKLQMPDVQVRLLDFRVMRSPEREFTATMREWHPDIVGITCIDGEFGQIGQISDMAKRLDPETRVCCGGPYPTLLPEDFARLGDVDSIVRGEGELAFPALAAAIGSGDKSGTGFKGIAVRRPDGSLPDCDRTDFIEDLDSLPFPDWNLVNIARYSIMPCMNGVQAGMRYMPVFTSRACPYNCAFCHDIFGKRVRFRSVENVVEEIERLNRDHSVDEIQIIDDIFNINRERVHSICDALIARRLKIFISFPNGIRGDIIDRETIFKLKQAGAYSITFGIETASPRLQKLIRKNLDIERARKAVEYADSLGIITGSFFIFGLPTETVQEIKSTLRLALELPLTRASFFNYVPFRGTALHDIAVDTAPPDKAGMLLGPTTEYISRTPYYKLLHGFPLSRFRTIAYLRFYLSPARIMKLLTRKHRKLLFLRQFGTKLVILAGTR